MPRIAGRFVAAPPSHVYEGTFLPVDHAAATSRAGGLVFGVNSRATARRFEAHQRGRAATLSLHLGSWVHFTGLHMDPTLPMSSKRRLLTDMAAHLQRQEGIKFLLETSTLLRAVRRATTATAVPRPRTRTWPISSMNTSKVVPRCTNRT